MPAVAEIVLQMDDSGVVTALQRTQGGLQKLGTQGNVVMTGITRSSGRTSAALRTMAMSAGLANTQFLGMARLGPAGIIASIALAVATAAQKFSSWQQAIEGAGDKLAMLGDRIRRFIGFEESVALQLERADEIYKLRLPLLEAEREIRHQTAMEALGFARNQSQANQRELRELELLKQKRLEDLRVAVDKQKQLAMEQFAPGNSRQQAITQIAEIEGRLQEEIEKQFRERRKNLEAKNAQQISDLRLQIERDGLAALDEIGAETSQGLTAILNRNVANVNRIMREELELFEKTGGAIIQLRAKRDAEERRFDRELQEFRRQNAEDTLRIEEQAALASLPPWQQTYGGIIVQAQQREREVREALRRTEIEEEDAARRITAIWQEAHAQQREALAGTLEEFASGPMEFFQRRWKQMLFRMIADTILASGTLRNTFGSIFGIPLGGGQGAGGGGQGAGGGIFGIPGLGGTPPFNPNPFFGGFASGFVPLGGVGLSGGGGGLGGPTLPAGSASGIGAQLSHNQQLFVGGAGLLGGLLSGSGNRFIRSAGRGLSGAALGAMIGSVIPGIGTVIGAVIGGIAGFVSGLFGGGQGKKRDRFLRDELKPAIQRIEDAYNLHQVDYLSAISQLESLRDQAVQQLRQLKGDGARVHPLIEAAVQRINTTEAERQRRLAIQFGPPGFERGGAVSSRLSAFGNVIPFPGGVQRSTLQRSTPSWMHYQSGGAVPAILHAGEFVMNRQAVQRVGRQQLEAMNSGAGGGFSVGGITVNVFPQSVDRAWLRNGGAAEIAREIRRAVLEGAA